MPLNFAEPGKIVVPLTRIIADGDKRLRQIIGFAVVDQTNVMGMYEGQGGYVAHIEDAVDIRGPSGKNVAENPGQVIEVEGPKGDDGQSAYELWQSAGNTGTLNDFLASLKGADASIGDIRMSVAQYLTDNPPAAGQNATDAMVESAVNAWLTAHPPKDGEDGEDGANANDAMVADAVAVYLFNNPPAAGKDATPEMVATQVATYLAANPPSPGKPGTNGKSAELQVSNGFIQWRQSEGSWANLVALSSLAGNDGKSVELQKTATAIQWRQVGGTWANLITIAELKGDRGDAGQTLLRQINVTDTATLAITLGVVDKQFPCVGAVPGERYQAYIRSFKLNNAATATAGRPAGYYVVAVDCLVADTINIAHMRPAIALGSKYELFTDIVKVSVS